jgi:hypothetical protein
LNAQAAVLQTARMAYAEALKEALPKKVWPLTNDHPSF